MLTKAVIRTSQHLGIPEALLAEVLHVSADTVAWMHSGQYQLTPNTEEWDAAILFVSAFRALDAVVGTGDSASKWLCRENQGLRGRPIDLIRSIEGLGLVARYLASSRGPA